MLATPIPGQGPGSRGRVPSQADLESEGDEFLAFMGQMNT